MTQKQRKVPMRQCVVSKQMYPKKELVRIVRNPDKTISIDPTGRKNGRGAYIALDVDVAKKAKEQNSFESILKVKVPEEFYDELIAYVEHQKARAELF